jgi:hypothetical protein
MRIMDVTRVAFTNFVKNVMLILIRTDQTKVLKLDGAVLYGLFIKHGYTQAIWRLCLEIYTKGMEIVVDAKLAVEVHIRVQLHIIDITFSCLQR